MASHFIACGLSNHLEHLISNIMSITVIDLLEMIDIKTSKLIGAGCLRLFWISCCTRYAKQRLLFRPVSESVWGNFQKADDDIHSGYVAGIPNGIFSVELQLIYKLKVNTGI